MPQEMVITPRNRLARACWAIIYLCLFRFSPAPFHAYRRMLLRLFGAHLAKDARVYPSCRIWAPWNLKMGCGTTLGPNVICYNVQRVELRTRSCVSQNSHLCTASHDYESVDLTLIGAPITLHPNAWVAADCFIGMGVEIGEGAIVGARAAVFRNVEPYTVVGGNPARVLKRRATVAGVRATQCQSAKTKESRE
jgi:putative colanic acid biosynthesis acetyltransferase WcaF